MQRLIENKKARFNYELLEKYSAGIELFGHEVKAIKKHQGSLDGSYVIIRGGEAFLTNASVPPYQPANTPKDYDEHRPRKLLLTKKQILELAETENAKGLTLVPISVYNNENKLKLEFAIARGKKKYDKRETIKKRESDRDIQRSLKNE
jgi:SsrA-binding protein